MTVILEDVLQLVRAQLGIRSLSANDRLMEDLGAESADFVNLAAAAEDRFDLTFDEAAIAAIRTPADLYRLIVKTVQDKSIKKDMK